MDKFKKIKLGGLFGLIAAVGYGIYSKKKEALHKEQEVIDISPEVPFEEDTQK